MSVVISARLNRDVQMESAWNSKQVGAAPSSTNAVDVLLEHFYRSSPKRFMAKLVNLKKMPRAPAEPVCSVRLAAACWYRGAKSSAQAP